MTAGDRAKLLAGDPVDGLATYTDHAPFEGTVSAAGGSGSSAAGTDGSRLFLTVPSGGLYALEIAGNPGNYDSPSPDDYGTYLNIPENTIVTNSVTTPADTANGVRHSMFRWVLKDADGGVINNGTSTQAVFTVTTNLVLTWYWTNEYQLAVQAANGGTVNSGAVDGWYTNAVQVSGILASPSAGYTFYEWSDDVPAGSRTNNPLTVIMDQPRTITAHFYSQGGETKTWDSVGMNAWESHTNWTPYGMAGPKDTAIIRSGSCLLSRPRSVHAMVVSNATSLVFTNWTTVLTGSTVTVSSGGRLELAPAFGNAGMSNRIHVVCQTLTIESNALVSATAGGYAGSPSRGNPGSGPGWGDSLSGGSGGGGSYGGQGGYSGALSPGGGTYGSSNAPVHPGSGGGAGWSWAGGAGGGAVRLDVSGGVTLDGTVEANALNIRGGGGSGGSILITCGRFSGTTNGVLTATGGNSTDEGGGGGGRIAVWHGGSWGIRYQAEYPDAYLGAVSVALGTGVRGSAAPGTVVWYAAPPAGALFIIR